MHSSSKRISSFLVSFLILVVLPASYYATAQISYGGTYSPLDEQTHMGYAWSVAHGEIPARGDLLPSEILNDWSCSGHQSLIDKANNSMKLPACDSGATADRYPGAGEQYNYFHPPLYYFITGYLAKAITVITVGLSFEQAARAISILWMIAGLIALYYALRAWNIDRTYCWATCSLVPFIPVFLNPATAVTNDAPGLLVGAGVVWVAKRFFLDEHYGMLIPSVIILLSCCIKGTFAFPFLALLIVVGLRSLVDFIKKKDIQSFRNILSVMGMGIVSLIGVFGWGVIQSHRGDPSYVSAITGVNTRPVRGLPIGEFLKTAMSTFDFSQIPGTLRRTNDSVGYGLWLSILQIVLLGAVFFLYFQNDKKKSQTYLIYSTILSMLLVPSLIQIREYLSNGSMLVGVSDRYAIAVVPLVLCCWALTLQNSKKPIVGWGIPAIGCVICFSAVLGLMPA